MPLPLFLLCYSLRFSNIYATLFFRFRVVVLSFPELFELEWIQAIVLFFSQLAWVLYVVGLVVAVFECAIECQSGRGSVRDTALNALKGFMAASLFSVVPVELYKFSVSLQGDSAQRNTGCKHFRYTDRPVILKFKLPTDPRIINVGANRGKLAIAFQLLVINP